MKKALDCLRTQPAASNPQRLDVSLFRTDMDPCMLYCMEKLR